LFDGACRLVFESPWGSSLRSHERSSLFPHNLAAVCTTLLLFVRRGFVRADFLSESLHKNIGCHHRHRGRQDLRPATPAKPIRYMLAYVGKANLERAWAGESSPPKKLCSNG